MIILTVGWHWTLGVVAGIVTTPFAFLGGSLYLWTT